MKDTRIGTYSPHWHVSNKKKGNERMWWVGSTYSTEVKWTALGFFENVCRTQQGYFTLIMTQIVRKAWSMWMATKWIKYSENKTSCPALTNVLSIFKFQFLQLETTCRGEWKKTKCCAFSTNYLTKPLVYQPFMKFILSDVTLLWGKSML